MMRPEILWCGTGPKRKVNGWSFPPAVRKLLIEQTKYQSVLHLFGGFADFGVRMDIDPITRPHVIADAWLPPFAKDSFDCVIMDPPYVGAYATMSNMKIRGLFAAAAWIATIRVIWFSHIWIESPARCKLEKAWLVRVGRNCTVRCLQFFVVPENKLPPMRLFKRGPAVKYNRWLVQPERLPLEIAC